jgi:hypothetical protein
LQVKDQHGVAAGQQDQLQLVGQSMEAAPMLNAYVRDRPAFAHVEVFLNAGSCPTVCPSIFGR